MAPGEEYTSAGLYDPAVDAGTGRLELLRWLTERGFTIEEMVAAHRADTLGALAGDRQLLQGPRYQNVEAADRFGLDGGELIRLAMAFGFTAPDPADQNEFALNEPEAASLAAFAATKDMFSDEEALGFARVVGSAVSRIAEAAVALFLTDVEGPSLAAADDELQLATSVLHAVELLDGFAPTLDPLLRRHIVQAIARSRTTIMDQQERLRYRYAVGFIDLVGFTPLSQDMSAAELGIFLRTFEARAHDAVTAVGARLVKLIGDEVMFVAPTVDIACRVAVALMSEQQTADHRTVVPRGGVAFGPVLVRGGDYFGDVVTKASRLADQAEPGQLLATEEFAAATTELDFTDPADRMLKGFEAPVSVRSKSFL
ncbi:MAG: adenylate cyclase regulatory domain-containing protein [Actinomycetota bacterium]